MIFREYLNRRKNKFVTFNLVTIDSNRLKSNLRALREISNAEIIPVLKSNAYGHGIRKVAEVMNQLSVKMVAVDGYYEARQIYDVFSGKILVLGMIDRQNIKLLKGKRISYVLQSEQDLNEFAKFRHDTNVHLELNTGMNRLGLQPKEIDNYLEVFKKHKNLHLEGIMTHLASSDEVKNPSTEEQVEQYDSTIEKILEAGFSPKYLHISNSAGAGRVKSRFANFVRTGIGLYGINTLEKNDKRFKKFEKLQPVLELRSTIVKTIDLAKGDKVGYGGSFTASRKMKIGILPLGYYEGISRELSNRGMVSYGDKYLPIVGRVCMNHTIIDLTNTNLKEGVRVVVISKNPIMKNSIIGTQREFGLFSYESLARLSENIRRKIV